MQKKPLPIFATDEEAEDFVENADLTEYDLSGGVEVRYDITGRASETTVPLPTDLVDAVKAEASREGVTYQSFIRATLERELAERSAPKDAAAAR